MKICSICGKKKNESDFYPVSYIRQDGTRNLRPDCKSCCNDTKQKAKRKNKARYEAKRKENKQRIKNYVIARKSSPCVGCGKSFPYYVMDFDHLSNKEHTINWLSNREFSIDRVAAEIDKCELVCANCHKNRTYLRNPRAGYIRPTKRLIIRAKSNPCSICGESYPYWIMELHHTDGNKDGELSYMMRHGATQDEVIAELKKCIPVCTNCHRQITWG